MKSIRRFIRFSIFLSLIAILLAAPGQFVKTAELSEAVQFNSTPCGKFEVKNSKFFAIPNAATSIVSADFNNDGIPDVALPMPNTNSVAVALGNDQSGFGTAVGIIAGVSPQHAVTGDFNRDGEVDLAVTSSADKKVNILLGDGTGNFELTNSYAVGTAPRKVETADINRDGWLDLIIGNTESPEISLTIYLGGASGFVPAPQSSIALNGKPRAFKLADFNNDQNPDIVAVEQNSFGDSFVRILNGNGLGGFTSGLSFTVPEFYTLDVADLNGDNFPDFAIFGYQNAKVSVFLNNQTGGFGTPLEFAVTNGSFQSIVAADLNADGNIDLTTGGSVLINGGSANFTISNNADVLGGDFVLADFNGDGIIDQASPRGSSDAFGTPPYWSFTVAHGLGNLKYQVPVNLQGMAGSSWVVSADFNNDGRVDVAAATPFQNKVQVSFQNANGSFTPSPTPAYTNGGSQHQYPVLAVGDFNGDGAMDMATIIGWANSAYILTNDGNGQFTSTSVFLTNPPFGLSPHFIQPGDFNNDGKTDLVVVGNGSFVILTNNGTGGFTVGTFVPINNQNQFTTVAVGDFDADGNRDLAVTRGGSNMQIYRGNGNGTFVFAGDLVVPSFASIVRSADLNGDNRSDLILTTGGYTGGNPNLVVYIANGAGGFAVTNYAVAATPNDVTVGDFNGDSFNDFVLVNSPRNHATLYTGNGTGAFAPQTPVLTTEGAYTGAAADFNQDQKLDLVLASRFGATGMFYNTTSKDPCITINDVQVTEGNSGTTNAQFTVSLSAAAAQNVTVNYKVVGRNARNTFDFTNVTGTLMFSPGQQTRTIDVPVIGDTIDEVNETFQVVLTNQSSNAFLNDALGIGTIIDDDALHDVSIGDGSMLEGTGGNPTQMSFPVTLSASAGRKAKVKYSLFSGTATAGDDFEAASGTVVFNEGDSVKQVIVKVSPDAFVEPNEVFTAKLTEPSGLAISDDEATGTILNDDIGGIVKFEAAVSSANESSKSINIDVRRTDGNAAGIVLMYSTSDGTATANQDYLPSSGKFIFDAGETLKTFTIPILDDAIDEPDIETVNLTLSNISGGAVLGSQSTAVLNIMDDDPPPVLVMPGTAVAETNSGLVPAIFAVRLLEVSGKTVTVDYATANGTAIAPDDYVSISGTVSFAPGETIRPVTVMVRGDTIPEPNETFFVNLTSPVNVVLQDTQAIGLIIDDDSNTLKTVADFDGDSKTDLSIFRPSGGEWWYLRSSDSTNRAFQFGASTDKIVPADYTGDGKTDVAFWRESSGEWFILRSEDSSFYSFPFGTSGDKPTPADFDGDSKDDPTIFRPSNATWYILNSSGGTTIRQFGIAEDIPQIGDFDGDRKADFAVFRPTPGEWWYVRSSDGQSRAFQFGISTDKPVPSDYTGDGKTDVAFFRPSVGEWFILRSEDSSFYSAPFGTGADIPVPGDYDGDGKSDVAVWRPSDTNWYILKSTGGFLIAQFGSNGDQPVPSAFVR